MTNDRPVEPHGPITPPGGINYNDVDMSNRSRNDNANNNANRNDNANLNANRNDNANYNANRNDNSNANRNDNSNTNRNDVRNNVSNDVRNNVSNDVRNNVRTGDSTSSSTNTNNNRTGDSTSNSSSRGGNSNISDNSRTNYYGGSASAPNVYASGFCSEGGSAGVYVLGIGVSGGKTTINESCLKMRDFQETMTTVCKASDDHANVALSSFQLELAAGREMNSNNPMAESVGRRVSRISDAKALSSMQLDNVCTTLATGSTANVETLKAAGLDRPLIIVEPASSARDQRILDEALVTKVEQIDKAVKGLQERPVIIQNKVEVGVAVIDVTPPAPPKPVHRPPSHKPPAPKAKDDDCDDPAKAKKK
ncbi:hypothetical protein KBI23_20430 [bacterium]|nr:hypothetical protein [bacterium]MBP9811483.1 hypothetical protein [bacterium]